MKEEMDQRLKSPSSMARKDLSTDLTIDGSHIINAMREKRTQEGLSLRQLGEHIHVSFSALSRIERGAGMPSTKSKIRIMTWLGMLSKEQAREAWEQLRHAEPSLELSTIEERLESIEQKIDQIIARL